MQNLNEKNTINPSSLSNFDCTMMSVQYIIIIITVTIMYKVREGVIPRGWCMCTHRRSYGVL